MIDQTFSIRTRRRVGPHLCMHECVRQLISKDRRRRWLVDKKQGSTLFRCEDLSQQYPCDNTLRNPVQSLTTIPSFNVTAPPTLITRPIRSTNFLSQRMEFHGLIPFQSFPNTETAARRLYSSLLACAVWALNAIATLLSASSGRRPI